MTGNAPVTVHLGERTYDIAIGRGTLAGLGPFAASRLPGHKAVVVTNPALGELWGGRVLASFAAAGIPAELCVVPEGEEAKTLATVSLIYDHLIERKYDRRTIVAALGGGVVGDVAGFAAASFLRGVPLIQIPSSLLAMVDSSVGGKTGVNHRLGKNLIGAFKQPVRVAADLDLLSTLPRAEFAAGMAEVIKYGMIRDPELFAFLESDRAEIQAGDPAALERIVRRSCEIKAWVVENDETEEGLRAILNFGHTFAHAAETLTGYSAIRHGEAVAMGMMAACRLGELAGGFPAESTRRLGEMLSGYGLPLRLPRFPVERYLNAMRSDKKAQSGRMRFVVPSRIGEVEVRPDIAEETVIRTLEDCFGEARGD